MKNAIKTAFRDNPYIFAIVIYAALVCIFYADKLVLGPYATVRIHDTFDSEFPRYAYLGNLFLKHGFFAWNPQVISGMPAYAYQFPPHYILCLLAAILPVWFIYSALVMLLMFAAAYGMYWFLKDFLGIRAELAILGGLLFALHAQIFENAIVHVVFNYAFPLFFMCLMVTAKQIVSVRTRMLSLSAIFLIIILSYPVITLPMFFVLQFLIIYFLNFERGFSRNLMILKSVLIWSGYALLSVPILYSLYKYIPLCQRGYQYVAPAIFLINLPKSFIQLFLQHAKESSLLLLIVGFIPLIFYSRKVRKPFLLLMLTIAISVLFQSPLLSVFQGTIFEKMDMSHFSWTIPFLIIIYIISGVEQFSITRVPRSLYFISFSLSCLLCCDMIFAKAATIPETLLNITVPLFILVFCLSLNVGRKGRKFILTMFVILLVVVAGQFKIERLLRFEYSPYKRLYESHPALNGLKREAEIEPFRVVTTLSFSMVPQSCGLETAESRSPIMPKSYKEFFRAMISPRLKTKQQADKFDAYWYDLYIRDYDIMEPNRNKESAKGLFNMPLLLTTNTKYIISRYSDPYLDSISEKMIESRSDNLSNPGILKNICGRIDDLLNHPYIKRLLPLNIRDRLRAPIFETLYCPSYYIYRLKGYFERGYLVSRALLLASDEAVLQALSGASLQSLKNTAFFSKEDGNFPLDSRLFEALSINDTVRLKSYGPDKLIFEGFITAPRILIVSNNYHPGWTANVNGMEKKVYRANHTFQAVFLEKPGSFNVALTYKDPLLWKSYWAIPFGFLLIIYSVFKKSRKKDKVYRI